MSLRVVSFVTYLSSPGTQWRFKDWDAYKFVQALKGNAINKWARIPVLGTRRHLEQSNANDTLQWFAEMAANWIVEEKLGRPLVLVPVPNSSCAVMNSKVPRTVLQAEALAARLQRMKVLDCLRWTKVMPSASKGGGSRDPQELYDHLVVTKKLPGDPLILIDDVRTTGAHLQATRASLIVNGGDCDLAICAARTVWDQEQDPFSLGEEEIEDFEPS